MDSPLSPIPTPASQRWREFRIRVLPVVVFLCIVLGASVLWLNFVAPVARVGSTDTPVPFSKRLEALHSARGRLLPALRSLLAY